MQLLLAVVLAVVLATPGARAETGQTRLPPLIDTDWLSANLDHENLVILDVRSSIDRGGDRSDFEKGHIPGAIYSSYISDGWREMRGGVAGLLPPVKRLEKLISSLGISNDDRVIIVPAGTGATDFGSAARVYWTFRVMGHDDVAILNGGHAGWRARGFEVASGRMEKPPVTDFTGSLQADLIASLDEVQEARNTQVQLVDARPSDYFRGETQSPAARAPGTIPGARNLPHTRFLGARDRVWYLDEARITERVNEAELSPDTRTIAFCNTGHWAATDWFVLSELAGFSEVALYDGSMAEWSQDQRRPLQVGVD